MPPPNFGKSKCGKCVRTAYFLSPTGSESGRCAFHGGMWKERKLLPLDESAKEVECARQDATVLLATKYNCAVGRKGSLEFYNMLPVERVVPRKGAVAVFFGPNKHNIGWDISSLCPNRVGPIDHRQPGLPPAVNLDHWYNGSKWFKDRTRDEFESWRRTMYTNLELHYPETVKSTQGKDIEPNWFVWVDREGNEKKLDRLSARQAYCTLYERAVRSMPDYVKIKEALRGGTNIVICGRAGYHPGDNIEARYYDTSRPFCAELILYAILKMKSNKRPWNTHGS
jgi:hypothetical protein